MTQMTVEKLFNELKELMAQGMGNKKIVIPDDNEGNGYHGVYYSCTADPVEVKSNIECSNGLIDSQEDNFDNIVIIG